MLYEYWNACPVGVGIGIATLVSCLLWCTFFIRARLIEYFAVRRMLQGATNQMLECVFELNLNKCGYDSHLLWRLGFAFYKLWQTRSQRYVLRKAIEKTPYAPFVKALVVFNQLPSCKATWWEMLKPGVK